MKHFSLFLLVATAITLGFFLYWVVTVFIPVALVELTYTVKKTTGTSNLLTLFIPNFRIIVQEKSRYPDGSVMIPSLFLDEPVIYNVDPNNSAIYLEALKNGIAHASGTKLPGYGGLGYYFAHSSNPSLVRQYNAVFYLLGKIKEGEKITLWREGKHYDYVVTETKITQPSDVSFLTMEQWDNETIILQTCWPPGTTDQRLLVFADRVESL